MKKLILALTITLSSVAQATNYYGPNPLHTSMETAMSSFYVTAFPTIVSYCAGSGACAKIIFDAKEDAAVYVATDGQFMGANLVQAFDELRSLPEVQDASEMDLARTVLAL